MDKEYLAKILTSRQITEDKWIDFYEEKLFSKDTTIEEMRRWARTKNHYGVIFLTKPE